VLIENANLDDITTLAFFEPASYDAAIIGLHIDEDSAAHVVYSQDKVIEIIMAGGSMSYAEAEEFYDYNTLRAIPYMGAGYPIMVKTFR